MSKSLEVEHINILGVINIFIERYSLGGTIYKIYDNVLYARGNYITAQNISKESSYELIIGINNKEKTAKLIYLLHKYFELNKDSVYDVLRLLK